MRDEDDQLYIYKLYGISVPRMIKATKSLRSRIGPTAQITEEQIENAQEVINNPRSNYRLQALNHIRSIEGAIEMARAESYFHDDQFDMLIVPLVKIKGEAAMFGNPLVSEISAKMVRFIEHYRRLDEDMLQLIEGYCKTIRISYEEEYSEIDSPEGRDILRELSHAMERYAEKFKRKTGR